MRNRWEDSAGVDLDAPATITERELRALRRRAGFGVFAALLGCIAVGGLGWALYAGPEGLERIQDVKSRYIAGVADDSETAGTSGTEAAAPAQTPVPVATTTSEPAADSAAGGVSQGQGAGAPPSKGEAPRVATQGSTGY